MVRGKPNLLVKGQPALMGNCMWAGPIGITDPTLETQQALGMAPPGGLASGFQPIKVVNAVESGNDIRSSAAADSNAKAKETKAKGESKAKEATESYKAIVKVEGEGKASQGQEITYKATVYDKDGPVEDCDVRWAIKVSENGAIDKNELKGMNGKRTIALKIKEEWIDKKEITIMPYLDSNSPKEDMSVKTNINPIAKTVYITQGNFIREVIQNFIKKNGHYPSEEMEKRLREEQIRENKEAHEGFKKYASEAKEKLEAKGFTVAIKNSMIEKEYNDMINDPNLIAYYMEAHGFYLEGECGENFQLPTGGFNLFKDKPDFSDDNWSLKDNNIDSITPEYFVLNEIPQLDLLLVYQISCENKFVDWSPHLGQSVEHFNDTEWDGKFVSEFKPKFEYVDKFVKEVIKKWDEKQGKP
ncbi:MAG: hypothetical protein LBH25_12975 [Fibromonadaceae bacterium]|jgi:hypothetical protein|nr:hypothetical protein [Fibromonadaceae bacterium]